MPDVGSTGLFKPSQRVRVIAKNSWRRMALTYGGIEMPTNATVVAPSSNTERGRIADRMPIDRPITRPTPVAIRPSTNVLAMAALSSGQTGRLPLMDRPQLKVTKLCNQEKYCDTMLPLRPFLSLYCWILALLALGLIRRELCPGCVPMRLEANTRNVMGNSVG